MSITYDFTTARDIALVRLALGDTVVNAGVLPSSANFSDEEIQEILTQTSDSVDATTYWFLEALAVVWSRLVDITVGPRKEALSDVATHYRRQADALAERTGLSTKAFTVALSRVDGYSEAAK